MARYFFDIYDDMVVLDDAGIELPDLDAARLEAVTAVCEIAKEIIPHDGPSKDIKVKVRDERGVVLTAMINFTVRMGD